VYICPPQLRAVISLLKPQKKKKKTINDCVPIYVDVCVGHVYWRPDLSWVRCLRDTATKLGKRCSAGATSHQQSSPGSSAGLKSQERPPTSEWNPNPTTNHVHLGMNGNQTASQSVSQSVSQQAANNLQWPQKCIFYLFLDCANYFRGCFVRGWAPRHHLSPFHTFNSP